MFNRVQHIIREMRLMKTERHALSNKEGNKYNSTVILSASQYIIELRRTGTSMPSWWCKLNKPIYTGLWLQRFQLNTFTRPTVWNNVWWPESFVHQSTAWTNCRNAETMALAKCPVLGPPWYNSFQTAENHFTRDQKGGGHLVPSSTSG